MIKLAVTRNLGTLMEGNAKVPYHSKRTIPPKTLKNILEGAELSIEQLGRLL